MPCGSYSFAQCAARVIEIASMRPALLFCVAQHGAVRNSHTKSKMQPTGRVSKSQTCVHEPGLPLPQGSCASLRWSSRTHSIVGRVCSEISDALGELRTKSSLEISVIACQTLRDRHSPMVSTIPGLHEGRSDIRLLTTGDWRSCIQEASGPDAYPDRLLQLRCDLVCAGHVNGLAGRVTRPLRAAVLIASGYRQ